MKKSQGVSVAIAIVVIVAVAFFVRQQGVLFAPASGGPGVIAAHPDCTLAKSPGSQNTKLRDACVEACKLTFKDESSKMNDCIAALDDSNLRHPDSSFCGPNQACSDYWKGDSQHDKYTCAVVKSFRGYKFTSDCGMCGAWVTPCSTCLDKPVE